MGMFCMCYGVGLLPRPCRLAVHGKSNVPYSGHHGSKSKVKSGPSMVRSDSK